jgi:hypothetical protein
VKAACATGAWAELRVGRAALAFGADARELVGERQGLCEHQAQLACREIQARQLVLLGVCQALAAPAP